MIGIKAAGPVSRTWPSRILGVFFSSASLSPILNPIIGESVWYTVLVISSLAAIAAVILEGNADLPNPRELALGLTIIVTSLFAGLLGLSLGLAVDKTLAVVGVLAIAFIGIPIVLRGQEQRRSFIATLLVVNLIAVMAALPRSLSADVAGRVGVTEGSGPIVAGRAAGLTILLLFAYSVLGDRRSRALHVSSIGLAIIAGLVLVRSASQGPIIATVLGLTVVVFRGSTSFARNRTKEPFRVAGPIFVLVIGFWGALRLLMPTAPLGRITRSVESHDARLGFIEAAMSASGQSPLGLGWGGFAKLEESRGSYPHNLILEATVEGGWLLGILLVFATMLSVARLIRATDESAVFVLAGLAFTLANALVSADVVGNRIFWAFLALGLLETKPKCERNMGDSSVEAESNAISRL